MISKENAYSLIQQSGNVPTLPAILLKLLEACDSEETQMSEIADLISKDPVLSFRVLQLVNSAYYGFRHSFKKIDQAVVYLGSNTIKFIVVTMSVHQVFEQQRFKNIQQFNINVFWYQSLLCATLARRISQKTGFANVDEAYLSGLLHDIGKLLLISTFPAEHEAIRTQTKESTNTLWTETQQLGVNHCEIGSWLIQKWRLNSIMADAIQYHHEPLEKVKGAFPLVKIIYAANLLIENEDNIEETCKAINLLFDLNHTDIHELIAGAEEEVEQVAQSLDVKIQRPPDTNNTPAEGIITKNNQNATTTIEQSPSPSLSNETKEHELVLHKALTARIKNISLISNFLEKLVQANGIEEIIAACEQAMSIFFNIEKVLFFLAGKDKILLKGRTSPESIWHQASQGLTLSLQQNSSLIVQTYHDKSMTYLTDDKSTNNLADKQILTTLRCSTVLLVPLIADKKPMGVLLLGLPKILNSLAASDSQLLQVVVQQVELCLHLENMKTQRLADLEAERMRAVSMTSRKVAHEINNPLGIISNYLTAMKFRLSGDTETQNELTIIDEEIHRISSLIEQMDIFSKNPNHNFELTDVNVVIDNIIRLVQSAHFAPPEILISFLPDDTLPQITTSRDAIKQILINLIKNGAEAMTSGGSIAVITRRSAQDIVPGIEGIEIIVADTGPGLPDSVTATLYTPFVTTKQNGHSGLGLSIVYKIVKDLGGKLSCRSSPKDGTSFSIFLPHSTQKG